VESSLRQFPLVRLHLRTLLQIILSQYGQRQVNKWEESRRVTWAELQIKAMAVMDMLRAATSLELSEVIRAYLIHSPRFAYSEQTDDVGWNRQDMYEASLLWARKCTVAQESLQYYGMPSRITGADTLLANTGWERRLRQSAAGRRARELIHDLDDHHRAMMAVIRAAFREDPNLQLSLYQYSAVKPVNSRVIVVGQHPFRDMKLETQAGGLPFCISGSEPEESEAEIRASAIRERAPCALLRLAGNLLPSP
jgi:hypothetical protein